MSTLKLKGSTSGYVEITAPAIAGDNQITLPTTAGTVTVKDASGNTQVGTGVTIGSPSANVFTLSTGGGERLRVDNSGTIIAGVTTVSAGSASAPSITPSGDSNTGIFFPSADTVAIAEGGVEAVRIDSSGRLLVGTNAASSNIYYTTVATNPCVQFETAVNSYSNGLSLINYSSSGYTPVLTLGSSSSSTQGVQTALANSFEMGAIQFVGSDGTNFRTGAAIVATNDQTASWAVGDCPTRLMFSTTADGASSPTERMRITSNGVTATYDFSSLSGVITGSIAARGFATRTGLNGSYIGNHFNFNWTGNLVAYIDLTNIGNVTLTSDYRIKQDIEDQLLEAIPRIKQLRPVTYKRANYNNIVFEDGIEREGFIAHELAEVIPSAVEGEKDAENQIQSINIDALVSVLTKALQEAVAKIETLEANNADLLARVSALESTL